MISVSEKILDELDKIPSDKQYDYIRDVYETYLIIWDINRGLLELCTVCSTLINNNNEDR